MSDPIPATDFVEADGQLVVIVDGELTATCDIVTTADDPEWCHRHQQTGGKCLSPPARFTEAMKACPTCEWQPGLVTSPKGVDYNMVPCPDCLDGRRVIEIEVECDHRSCRPEEWVEWVCRYWKTDGVVSHRVVVTDVIDVRNRVEFKVKVPRWHELDALPGRYAVICELVDS